MSISRTDSNLQAALHYASIGFRVFPVHGFINGSCTCCRDCKAEGNKPGKHPACPHGLKEGTCDPAIINEWFDGKPWLNVGIALDANMLGLDVDPSHNGEWSLKSWEDEHGRLPITPQVGTGSGGDHYYFRLPDGVVVKNKAGCWAQGIDTRSAGGYLVAPPSVHESGGRYQWLTPLETPLALAPDWLIAIVGETPKAMPEATSKALAVARHGNSLRFKVQDDGPCDFVSHPGEGEGKRNDTLCRLTGVHLSRGDSIATIEASALAWAERCGPPCEPMGVLRKVRALAIKEASRRGVDNTGGGDFGIEPEAHAFAPGMDGMEAKAMLESEGGGFPSIPCQHSSENTKAKAPESDRLSPVLSLQPQGDTAPADDWPILGPEAYHGLAGEIIKAIEPETEADPVGILLTFLSAFGNAIGRGAYFSVGADSHHGNLFGVIVGNTASRKGVGLGVVKHLMKKAAADWYHHHIGYGLSSGEGLTERVRDDEQEAEGQRVFSFATPEAKRLYCIETEFSKLMTVKGREGNTLNANLRNAYDGAPMESITRGKKGVPKNKASNHHISILGHITPKELAKVMGGSVDMSNGFTNRFLWALVKRARCLPEGGDISVIDEFIGPLQSAIIKAKGIRKVVRDAEAKALWAEVYQGLSAAEEESSGRAEAHTLRLSLLYALLDGSEVVSASHLKAALAVWTYCEASAKRIFGGQGQAVILGEEPLDFRLLMMIEAAPGIKRNVLLQALPSPKRNHMGEALATLESKRLAHPRMEATAGRSAECWYPGPKPEGTDDGISEARGDGTEGMEDKPPTIGSRFTVPHENAPGTNGMEGKPPLSGGNPIATALPSLPSGREGKEEKPRATPSFPSVPYVPEENAIEGVGRSDPFPSIPFVPEGNPTEGQKGEAPKPETLSPVLSTPSQSPTMTVTTMGEIMAMLARKHGLPPPPPVDARPVAPRPTATPEAKPGPPPNVPSPESPKARERRLQWEQDFARANAEAADRERERKAEPEMSEAEMSAFLMAMEAPSEN